MQQETENRAKKKDKKTAFPQGAIMYRPFSELADQMDSALCKGLDCTCALATLRNVHVHVNRFQGSRRAR